MSLEQDDLSVGHFLISEMGIMIVLSTGLLLECVVRPRVEGHPDAGSKNQD